MTGRHCSPEPVDPIRVRMAADVRAYLAAGWGWPDAVLLAALPPLTSLLDQLVDGAVDGTTGGLL